MRQGTVVYRPIRDWAVLIPAIAAGGVFTLVAARAVASWFRRDTAR
jgi:hypothetical protein